MSNNKPKRTKLEDSVYAVSTPNIKDNAKDVKRIADRMSEDVDEFFDPKKLGSNMNDKNKFKREWGLEDDEELEIDNSDLREVLEEMNISDPSKFEDSLHNILRFIKEARSYGEIQDEDWVEDILEEIKKGLKDE